MDSVEEFYVRLASKPLPIFCFLVSIVNFLLPRAELPLGVSSLLYTGFRGFAWSPFVPHSTDHYQDPPPSFPLALNRINKASDTP